MRYAALILAVMALCSFVARARADERDDVLRAMAKCAALAGKEDRLACFDQETPQLKAALAIAGPESSAAQAGMAPASHALAAPTVPATGAASAPPTPAPITEAQRESWFGLHLFGGRKEPQTTAAEFGNEHIAANAPQEANKLPKEIDKITAHLTDYALNPYGRFTVFLDNGQIWQQVESDTAKAEFKRVAADNVVEISRAIFGSYTMTVKGSNRDYKVIRIK